MDRLTGILKLAPIAVTLALCTTLTWADDSMARVTPTDHQLLKECMERQKTTSNVTISNDEAKRYCKDRLKRQKATGASSERQPVDKPHAPADATAPVPPPTG